jgi:hypothetical protein
MASKKRLARKEKEWASQEESIRSIMTCMKKQERKRDNEQDRKVFYEQPKSFIASEVIIIEIHL